MHPSQLDLPRWSVVVRRRYGAGTSRLYLAASLALAVLTGLTLKERPGGATADSSSVPDVPMVVAAQAIRRGTTVSAGQLRVVRVPAPLAQPGAFRTTAQAAGRVALTDLSPGEAVTRTRLARVRAGPVASLVPPGLRAFAVPTALPSDVVRPGDRVDVLATFGSGQPHTEVVVSGVEVLFVLRGGRVGGSLGSDRVDLDAAGAGGAPASTLVLLVSPDQEERLAYARAFANLEVTVAPLVEEG